MRAEPMKDWEVRAALIALGWDKDTLATRLDINRTSVQRWLTPAYTVPEHVAAWLRELVAAKRGGDVEQFNALVAALPNGWRGKNHVRNKRADPTYPAHG
jgi:hypothetical protein